MERVNLNGVMEEFMKENLKIIKNMDSVYTNGQIKKVMLVCGQKESNKVKASLY